MNQIFRTISNTSRSIKHWRQINQWSKHISIKFTTELPSKLRPGINLNFFIPETMKLLGCAERRITKYKIGENVLQLEITEIIIFFDK